MSFLFGVFLLAAWPATEDVGDTNEAMALIESGRYFDARELADRALAAELPLPQTVRWLWILGDASEAQGDYEEAIAAYEKLATAESGESAVEATLQLARCQLRTWDTDSATRSLARLASRDLGDEDAAERDELAAIAVFLGGRQKEARDLFEALPHKSPAAWHYLGLISLHSGAFEVAVEHFERALAGAPNDFYNRLYRASCLVELNRLEEARKALVELEEVAVVPEVKRLEGQVALRAEHFLEATRLFREALELSPQDPRAQFGLATSLRRRGQTDEARTSFLAFRVLHERQERALKRAYELEQRHLAEPEKAAPALALAQHYLGEGDAAEAERMAWRALRADRGRLDARLCLARALVGLGRYRAAATQYRLILRARPNHAEARDELRQLAERHGRRLHE